MAAKQKKLVLLSLLGIGHLAIAWPLTHTAVTQGMSESLRSRLRLEDDEIMKALRANPMTARHAEARAKEIINDLVTADFRSNAQRAADQLSSKCVLASAHMNGSVCLVLHRAAII